MARVRVSGVTEVLKIEAATVPGVRQGLLTLLAADAETMAGALVTRDWRAHEIAAPRARMERCWALLDTIGWSGAAAPLEVDLEHHGATIGEACAAIVPLLEGWVAETPADDPRVAARVAALEELRELAANAR
jgi:hypothetical protein